MSDQTATQTVAVFETPFSKKILAELENLCAKVVRFPTIETVRNDNLLSGNDLTDFVRQFDWLIFTDILAVDHFIEMLTQSEFDLYELDNLRICALGEAVADRLRFNQIHADLIPSNNRPEMILRQFDEYLVGDFRSQTFLTVKSALLTNPLKEKLIEAGCQTSELDIYRPKLPQTSEFTKLKTLLLGGAIDVFVFTNVLDTAVLANLFPAENLIEIFDEIKVLAADPLTYQNLTENNFKPEFFRFGSK